MVNQIFKTKINKPGQSSVFFLLFLAISFSDFHRFGIYILLTISILYLLLHIKNLTCGVNIWTILLFALAYFAFTVTYQKTSTSMKIFVLPLLWLLGYNMPENKKMQSIFKVALFLAVGMCLHGIANFLYNFTEGTEVYEGLFYDFWSGTISAATGQATNFALFLGLMFWCLVEQKNKLFRFCMIVLLVFAYIYSVQIGVRAMIVMGLIAFDMIIFFTMCLNVQNQQSNKNIKFVLGIFVLVCIGCGLFIFDVWGIRSSFYEGSYLAVRINAHDAGLFDNTERFQIRIDYFKHMFDALWGGDVLKNKIVGNYAHELWLDIHNDAGIIAYALIIFYYISTLMRVRKICKNGLPRCGRKDLL